MRITELKRKVTGRNYDNIELTVQLQKGTDISDAIKKAVEIDKIAREMLDKIYENQNKEYELEMKKNRLLEKIESLKSEIMNSDNDGDFDEPF